MDKKNKFLISFFAKAILAYFVWFILYENWLMKVGSLDNLVIGNLVYFTDIFLKGIGYETFVYDHIIGIQGSHGVFIGTPCNGLDLMALFAGFVIIFKGRIIDKVWFICLGLIIIHFLNLIRVISLTIIAKTSPDFLDFNHKYTFTIALYLLVFVGWMIWVGKFSIKK